MNPEKNPYAALLAKLSGVMPPPVRARQGWQQLMHERKDLVGPAVSEAWERRKGTKGEDTEQADVEQADAGGKEAKNDVGFRADVVRKLFKALPMEEQRHYADAARRDKEKALSDYKAALTNSLSSNRSPENRQL